MKLAFSSNAYLHFSIEDTIAKIASLGYTGIEVLADVPHAWPAGLLDERKESIRRSFGKASADDLQRQRLHDERHRRSPAAVLASRLDRSRSALSGDSPRAHQAGLAIGRRTGRPRITTEPGGLLAPGQTWQQAADIFYEELMPCIEVAEQCGVELLIEPEPELLIERFGQYLEFVGRIDSPAVGLNFDIGHAYCVGEDPQDWVARMAPQTRHYHFEDIAATRVHKHLIPGTGSIDFAATLQAIAQTGYDDWITVELYPYVPGPIPAAREARAFLLRTAGQIGIQLD